MEQKAAASQHITSRNSAWQMPIRIENNARSAGKFDRAAVKLGRVHRHNSPLPPTNQPISRQKLPSVPATQEAGFSDAEYPIWFGVFLPAKTPREIVSKLHDETLRALQSPKVKEKLASLGVDPMVMTPDEFQALVEQEIDTNGALVKAAGLTTH